MTIRRSASAIALVDLIRLTATPKPSDRSGMMNNAKPTTVDTTRIPRVHNKHHKTAPADAVYIGRGSKWGNPYKIGEHGTRAQVIELFKQNVLPSLDVSELKGKHLVCFCKPQACHGDLLLEKANQGK